MNFSTTAEAFNFYRNQSVEAMEKRAAEIGNEIDSNPDADIKALNVELMGIKEARDNTETKMAVRRSLTLLTGSDMKPQEKRSFDAESVLDTAEYRSAFYKTILGQKLNDAEERAFAVATKVAETRADEFNAAGDNLAVIPTQTLNEVIAKARTMGGLLGECRRFSVPSKLAVPIGTPATKAEWHIEGASVDAEKVNTASVIFEGNEIIKVFSISAKARRMSVNAFEAYLVDELVACVMETINDSLINGTGIGQGTGLETGIVWGSGNIVTGNKYENIVEVVATLKRGYAAGAKWAMNNATLYNVFYGMVDGNGRPIFITDPKSESVGKILGFDVIVDDNIEDNTAYFGNFSKYLAYNLPESVIVEVSRESSFRKGLIDYRALAIADTKPLVEEAFVKFMYSTM